MTIVGLYGHDDSDLSIVAGCWPCNASQAESSRLATEAIGGLSRRNLLGKRTAGTCNAGCDSFDIGNTMDGAFDFDSALSWRRSFWNLLLVFLPSALSESIAAFWMTGASARVAFTSEPAWSSSQVDDDDDDEREEEQDLDSLTEESESLSAVALHLPRMTVPSAALLPDERLLKLLLAATAEGKFDVDGESAWRMLTSAVRISGE